MWQATKENPSMIQSLRPRRISSVHELPSLLSASWWQEPPSTILQLFSPLASPGRARASHPCGHIPQSFAARDPTIEIAASALPGRASATAGRARTAPRADIPDREVRWKASPACLIARYASPIRKCSSRRAASTIPVEVSPSNRRSRNPRACAKPPVEVPSDLADGCCAARLADVAVNHHSDRARHPSGRIGSPTERNSLRACMYPAKENN